MESCPHGQYLFVLRGFCVDTNTDYPVIVETFSYSKCLSSPFTNWNGIVHEFSGQYWGTQNLRSIKPCALQRGREPLGRAKCTDFRLSIKNENESAGNYEAVRDIWRTIMNNYCRNIMDYREFKERLEKLQNMGTVNMEFINCFFVNWFVTEINVCWNYLQRNICPKAGLMTEILRPDTCTV